MDEKELDQTLIDNAKIGDLDSFSKLVAKYERRIYRLVYGVLKHDEDTEDVTQETFLNAYRALHTFRGDALFYTWLYRIALNRAFHRRTQQRVLSTHFESNGEEVLTAEHGWDEETPNESPAGRLEQKQALQIVERILTEMPEQFADALILRVLDGMSYGEISQIRTISLNTVRTRIFRARAILAERIKE
ncbi:sigma-70 family RNA polymerase sigma factor [Massilia sp. DWR3-1-1]|uniref:sigma-70 family RNA polymerase sigma factor n=1 Tax=Massilia sp. DWR3-1-1 TaxID=2804559 RepID=UPI003CF51CB6